MRRIAVPAFLVCCTLLAGPLARAQNKPATAPQAQGKPPAGPQSKPQPATTGPQAQGQPAAGQAKSVDSSGWSVEQALANLRSSDRETRLAALLRLAREPGPTIQKWIAEAAQYDPEPRIRYEAVSILGKRKEPASLPVLMWLAEHDKDERVRALAWQIVNSAPGARPAKPPATAGAGTAQPPAADAGEKTGAPKTGQPEKHYDSAGNELPPGYTESRFFERQRESEAYARTGQLPVDEETVVDASTEKRNHSGFLPVLGYLGALGAPRDTACRTNVGIVIGYAGGSYDVPFSADIAQEEVDVSNSFDSKDFEIILSGRFSPANFLEIGLDLEVMTWESLSLDQSWDSESESATEYEETNEKANGYSGVALGLLSLDLKALFVDTSLIKAGMALRLTLPTHTGDRFENGIGASSMFAGEDDIYEIATSKGLLWGIEPGILASVAPLDGLTLFADIDFAIMIVTYDRTQAKWIQEPGNPPKRGEPSTNSLKAVNLLLVPNVGARYRLLQETLGFQVAVAPAAYLGTATDAGLASFGIVPGVSYRLLSVIDLALTASIEATPDAPAPIVCTDYERVPCGVGRRFGIALSGSHDF